MEENGAIAYKIKMKRTASFTETNAFPFDAPVRTEHKTITSSGLTDSGHNKEVLCQ